MIKKISFLSLFFLSMTANALQLVTQTGANIRISDSPIPLILKGTSGCVIVGTGESEKLGTTIIKTSVKTCMSDGFPEETPFEYKTTFKSQVSENKQTGEKVNLIPKGTVIRF